MPSESTVFYRDLLTALQAAEGPCWIHGDVNRSYAELGAVMRRINTCLSGTQGIRVAVFSGKSLPAYAAIYAILLSKNSWVPLNPEFPAERTLQMLELATPGVILTDRPLPDQLTRWAQAGDVRVLSLPEAYDAQAETDFEVDGFDDDAEAYVMFTSGSTGLPKGVPMTHANFQPFVRHAMQVLPLRQGDVFSDYHDFGFDISIFYLFCCPLAQGTFAPALTEAERLLPLAHLRTHGVTVLASVPSILARLRAVGHGRPIPSSVRVLFMCGEPFRLDLLRFCLDDMAVAHVSNWYGLTETGVENFWHPCSVEDIERFSDIGFAPIGTPLPATLARVEAGELLIGGVQVTPGYLGGIGSERFIEHDDVRWYRTGDRVVERDGLTFCKGRLDWQIKLNGYRIELMDIEANLRTLPGLTEAVCFVESIGGRDFLMAAIQCEADLDLDHARAQLATRLPPYMVPSALIKVTDLPLNKSGKIDRPAVQRIYRQGQENP
ncbi:AMP-binding protein [Magnetospirillum moscoviense]|uniref:AMP-dependent synthetase/ligase domain-containing protein n=1 Tax=Magnetospirillum moscoviense TaxID=1437059 RepID=A0A178MYR4_9PROT|nr:AMP-binding protein [Magnetospirillum moscoviense]OAN55088.1 hypothetical protein A6A05_00575 [Magnetospirillum moscoviense]